ncbi:uncharacterized protein LOC120350891 isoform X2 [Nilaparvata lugens]|uniref:uncharacterized protein LOC120350891 isoform X2 n=1 Tax=Nilaparvata lugens TaxID=108931 RepID=UPI00193D96C4|nr:uncharacterized protein LOC120350891 isoform X2 [Nilaparvata lugens]
MGYRWVPLIPISMYYTKYRTLVNSLSATITSLCLLLSFFGNRQLEYCLNESHLLLSESNLKYQHLWYNPITFLILVAATHCFKIVYFILLLPHTYKTVIISHVSNFPANFIQYIVLFMATTAEISFHNINDRLVRMKKYKIVEESIVTQMELHWRVVDFVEKFNHAMGVRLLAMLAKTLMFKFFVIFTIILHYVPSHAFKKADLPFYAVIDWAESSIISFGIIIYTSYCSNRLFTKSKHTLVHLRELSYNNTLSEKVDTVVSVN